MSARVGKQVMKNPSRQALPALWLALVLASGCAYVGTPPTVQALDGTSWRLSALSGPAQDASAAATLNIEGARAHGTDGCNRFIAAVDHSKTDLRLAPGSAGTLMACPPGTQLRAKAYRMALSEARHYRVQSAGAGAGAGAQLDLLDAGGRVLATFIAQPQALARTQWEVTGVNNGRGAVAGLVPGTKVVLIFGESGRLSGSAGCNRFSARYEQTATAVRIEQPVATRMACPAGGVMAQEQSVLMALEAARQARIEADTIELRDAGGALQLAGRVLKEGP
jgi:heat shock protein HslJ